MNLFSAAKAVSAMVMHKLEEMGAFDLDDSVAEHLPGFERHGKGDITIRHLLTHRAGIAAWPGAAFDAHNVETGFLPGPVIDLFIKRVLGKSWATSHRHPRDLSGTQHDNRRTARGGNSMTITESDTWNTPFLQGALARVFDERDDTALEVIGEIPAGLAWIFVRTGPTPQFAPKGAYHPFDGDGMLHVVYLQDGTARYRNRWVATSA